jgi:hypothetical protein
MPFPNSPQLRDIHRYFLYCFHLHKSTCSTINDIEALQNNENFKMLEQSSWWSVPAHWGIHFLWNHTFGDHCCPLQSGSDTEPNTQLYYAKTHIATDLTRAYHSQERSADHTTFLTWTALQLALDDTNMMHHVVRRWQQTTPPSWHR